jgi:hypothetical protein
MDFRRFAPDGGTAPAESLIFKCLDNFVFLDRFVNRRAARLPRTKAGEY